MLANEASDKSEPCVQSCKKIVVQWSGGHLGTKESHEPLMSYKTAD